MGNNDRGFLQKLKTHKLAHRIIMLLVSALLLLIGLWVAGVENVVRDMERFPAWVVIAIILLFGLNLFLVSFRLGRILSHFGMTLPIEVVARASVSGHLAGMFMLSLFGQVVGRHLVLHRHGTASVIVASLTTYERIVLLLVSGGLCLFGAARILDVTMISNYLGEASFIPIIFASMAGMLFSLWIGCSRFEAQMLGRMLSQRNLCKLAEVFAITLAGQLLVMATFALGVLALEPGVNLWDLLAAVSIISFAASLPISVNGWGVRELAATFTLGLLGVPSSNALAVSILVGLCATVVVLAVAPVALRRPSHPAESPKEPAGQPRAPSGAALDFERIGAWMISTAAAVLIFFQIHIPLAGGIVSLNLADPFAVIALAAIVLHAATTRQPPRWRFKGFNTMLMAVSLLLLLGFVRGMLEIGVTQWALAGRVMGWLVILGYLGIGHLVVSHLGARGLRRFVETAAATAVVIVLTQAVLRLLDGYGWRLLDQISMNFEGFAGNRNAFAFQMVVCSILLLAYSRLHHRADALTHAQVRARSASAKPMERSASWLGRERLLFSAIHGVILAGLLFSSSKAGLITEAGLLLLAIWARLAHWRMICLSVFHAAMIWALFVLALPLLLGISADGLRVGVQSSLSYAASNQERLETITRGIDMWFQHPLLGSGLGVFFARSTAWFGRPTVIHSTPVWILAEFGIVGASLLLASFLTLCRQACRDGLRRPPRSILLLLLIAFMAFGFVHEIFFQRIFWLVTGAASTLFYSTGGGSSNVRTEANELSLALQPHG